MERNLTLKLRARSPVILYLVSSSEQVRDAIKLFTHVWGGIGNAILPVPRRSEFADFVRAVDRIAPDIILTSKGADLGDAMSLLRAYPASKVAISSQDIREHCEGPNRLHILGGMLAHAGVVLSQQYPTRMTESNVRVLVGEEEEENLTAALQYGIPTAQYKKYLQNHIGARGYRPLSSYEEALKAAILAAEFNTPLHLTAPKLAGSSTRTLFSQDEMSEIEGMRAQRNRTVFLFLVSNGDYRIACSFWNIRRNLSTSHVIPVAFENAFESPGHVLSALREVSDYDEIICCADVRRSTGHHLHRRFRQAAASIGWKVPIKIYYRQTWYHVSPGHLVFGQEEVTTRATSADNILRIRPPQAPAGVLGSEWIGYSARIEFEVGAVLNMPRRPWSSVLLLNSQEQIDAARENRRGMGTLWLSTSPVQAVEGGVQGLYQGAREIGLVLHPDDVIIREYLHSFGYTLRTNRHTRYASGVVRLLGGLNQALLLLQKGGIAILLALSGKRADQSGLFADQVCANIKHDSGVSLAEARATVQAILPQLLKAGLVRRGMSFTCTHCDLKEWFAISRMREIVRCPGCLLHYQLPTGRPQYTYVANTLARRFVEAGGHAVLATARVLREIDPSGFIQFGGDILRIGEKVSSAEVDVVFLSGNSLVLGECKAFYRLGREELDDTRASIRKIASLAKTFGTNEIVLGITTHEVIPGSLEEIAAVAVEVESEGVGFTMIHNGDIFIGGAGEVLKPMEVTFAPSRTVTPAPALGKLPTGFGVGWLSGPLDEDMLSEWDSQLRVTDQD